MTQTKNKAALLDQVRGVLYPLANAGEEFLRPVSSIALHHALAGRDRKTSVSTLMDDLLGLRDVQDLPPRHWLPVSTRAISLGECALIVSGKPSDFLRTDHGLELFGVGIGRLASQANADALAQEPLTRWLNAPPDTANWADELVRSAKWTDPLGAEDLQLFDHWSRRPAKRWLAPGTTQIPDGMVVAKQIFTTKQADHYLLRFRHGRPRQLFQVGKSDSAHRLRIALLARAGNSRQFTLSETALGAVELATYYLPADEMRLLRAIANVEETEDNIVATLPREAIAAICEILVRLGLKQEGKIANG